MAATNFLSHYRADNFRLERTRILTAPADATYNVIALPKFTFVQGVMVYVNTAWDVDANVEVGFSGNGETANTQYFLDTALVVPSTTGWKSGTVPKYFNSASGFITVTTTKNGTAGNIQVWALYTIIH
jgi:hypothetical protein